MKMRKYCKRKLDWRIKTDQFLIKIFVDFASVANDSYIYMSFGIINGIDYPIIADSNAPKKVLPSKFFTPSSPGIYRKAFDFLEYS